MRFHVNFWEGAHIAGELLPAFTEAEVSSFDATSIWESARLLVLTGMTVAIASLGLTAPCAAQGEAQATRLAPEQIYDRLEKAVQVISGQEYFKGAHYVGSETCRDCHASQVKDWHQTWHAKMEQWASPQTVLGDFNDQIVTYSDISALDAGGKPQKVTVQIKAHRVGDEYFFTILDKDNAANNQTYKIAKTLGGKWDQGYEVKMGTTISPRPCDTRSRTRDGSCASSSPRTG